MWIFGGNFLGFRRHQFWNLEGGRGAGLLFLFGLSMGWLLIDFFSFPLRGVWGSSRVLIFCFLGVNFLAFKGEALTFSGKFDPSSGFFRPGGSSGGCGWDCGATRVLIFCRILGLRVLVGFGT